jgi:hypothetical protein
MMARMKRITPWLCLLSITSYLAGCGGAEVDLHFDHDASFGHDAGDAGPHGGAGSSADDDGGAIDDEDGGVTNEPPPSDAGSHAGQDGGSAQSPAAAFPSMLARATCDALEDCYGDAKLLANVLGGRDCVTLQQGELLASDLSYLQASIDAGLVKLHADRIGDCLADVRALGCNVRSSRLPASCKAAFAGTGLAASECTTHLDCMGDSFCAKGEQQTCPGVCAALQNQGQPCTNDDDAECDDGLVCFRATGKCEALRATGEECGMNLPVCKPGLTCLDQGDGPACVAITQLYAKKLGDDCDAKTDLCAPGLVCESVSGGTPPAAPGKCAETVASGANCKRSQPNQCPLDQYCDATDPGQTGTCVDRPGDGDACLSRTPACADGLACIDGTCRAIHGNGEPCTSNAQCWSGTCNDSGECEGALMCAAP